MRPGMGAPPPQWLVRGVLVSALACKALLLVGALVAVVYAVRSL